MKKLLSSLLIVLTILLGSTPCFAQSLTSTTPDGGIGTKAILVPKRESSWSFTILSTSTESSGSWTLLYVGEPAKRDNETDTISKSIGYSHTYSGALAAPIAKDIQLQLGYSFGKEESFSVSKTSAPLAKGEYVKAYYLKNYEVKYIRQNETIHVYGWETTPGGGSRYVDYYEPGDTKYMYAKRAIMPKLTLEYYSTNNLAAKNCSEEAQSQEPILVEIYEYIDGEYTLVSTQR